MTKKPEGREFTRSPIRARVEVRLGNGILVEGRAQDISLNGIFFVTERSLPIGTHVRLNLVLDGGDTDCRIETYGTVVRIGEHGVAINFEEIDETSITHLRRLIMYNAEDADQVDQEFHNHVGIKAIK